jgi:biopolymer transport protein ExbB/TolQ
MPAKKAKQVNVNLILLIFSALIVVVFIVIFVKQLTGYQALKLQSVKNLERSILDKTNNIAPTAELTPEQQKIKEIEERTRELIRQIVKQGKTKSGGLTRQAQDKLVAVINQEIEEKIKLRTPEQLKADEARQAQLQLMIDKINKSIESKLKKK